ncbi:MAG TPA: ATP-binding protein [Pyrinomonadaceae bacterium]|nr:ATP-binding protein [Pyrinomonadaceae bacterium]
MKVCSDRQTGGVGLGLAIVARAVALHGGVLRAFNEPGGGLSVTMRLPLRAAPVEMAKEFGAPGNNENTARTNADLVK